MEARIHWFLISAPEADEIVVAVEVVVVVVMMIESIISRVTFHSLYNCLKTSDTVH